MHSRRIALLGAVIILLLSVVATGSYDGVAADRPVAVGVSDDDSAYLGFDGVVEWTDSGANLTVTVTNQFPSRTSLTEVRVTVSGVTVDLADGDPLTPGESASATFSNVLCPSFVDVEAVGPDVEVTLDRRVQCPATPTPTATTTATDTAGTAVETGTETEDTATA